MIRPVIGIKKRAADAVDQLVGERQTAGGQTALSKRCNFDIEMLEATGVCNGIENYYALSDGPVPPGEPPPTLFEFIPDNAIVFAR